MVTQQRNCLPQQDIYCQRSPEDLQSLALLAAEEEVEEQQWVSKQSRKLSTDLTIVA